MNPISGNAKVLADFATPTLNVDRIVSDAQSGAARGALDAAIYLGMSHGGWCASDRLADDGELHQRYGCHPTTGGFAMRCAKNVQSTNATLLLSLCVEDDVDGRTAHARDVARRQHKASAHLQLFAGQPPGGNMVRTLRHWLVQKRVRMLHVTGPLEIKEPGLSEAVKNLLVATLGKAEVAPGKLSDVVLGEAAAILAARRSAGDE